MTAVLPPDLEAALAAAVPEPGARCEQCGGPAVPWPDYADGRAVLCRAHLRERMVRWLDAEFRPVELVADDGRPDGWARGPDAQRVRFGDR